MQAFLRDELLAYCREAPPEFNDHQRDVFCVFSGTGVGRLREYLNTQKAAREAEEAEQLEASSVDGDEQDQGREISDAGFGVDGHGEGGTPVFDIHGNLGHAPGATPVVGGSALGFASHQQPLTTSAWHHHTNAVIASLSQSAPAAAGMWALGLAGGAGMGGGGGGAQQVTGMMSAAALDEVDETEVEGDEAFGEGSEVMDRD